MILLIFFTKNWPLLRGRGGRGGWKFFLGAAVLQITVLQFFSWLVYIRQRPKPLRHAKGILKINLGSMGAIEWGLGVAPKHLVFLLCTS